MTVRTNFIRRPYPVASTLSDWTLRWFGGGGTATGTHTIVSSGGPTGGPFVRKTWSTVPTNNGDSGISIYGGAGASGRYALTAGETQVLSGYARTNATGKNVYMRFQGFNSAGTMIQDVSGTVSTIPVGLWTRYSVSFTVAASVVTGVAILDVQASGTVWAASDTFDVTNILWEHNTTTLGEYFDGSWTQATWYGAAELTESFLYVSTITLTQYLDAAPSPRVEVLLQDCTPNAAYATIWRQVGTRSMKVRGAVKAGVSGGAITRMDMEVPFAVNTTYKAELFNSSGTSLGFSTAATTNLAVSDTWIHNPLTPNVAMKINVQAQTGNTIQRPNDADLINPPGRTVGVLISRGRQGVKGTTLNLETLTAADADLFSTIIGYGDPNAVPIICLRSGLNLRFPDPFFMSVLDPKEKAQDLAQGGNLIDWEVVGDEVSPPTPGLLVPLLSRADLNAYYASRTAINSGNLTRLAVNRRYDLAGYA